MQWYICNLITHTQKLGLQNCLCTKSPAGLLSLHSPPPFPRLSQVMGLIPHVSSYISNLLPRVLNYGWNLPDKAQSYISLPLSSHLDPSGFIILCEDHLAVSKPCPATWELTLIFIRKAFLERGERQNRWAEKERKNMLESVYVCARLCVACAGNCERFRPQPKVVRAGQTWHIEDDAAICFRLWWITFFFLILSSFFWMKANSVCFIPRLTACWVIYS